MFIPPAYRVDDLPTIHAFIRQHGFALLVSVDPSSDGVPTATHLPLLLTEEPEGYGSLSGHVARANPQAKFMADQPVLAVFSGPHTHVSAAWYGEQNVVPTWNYVAVHAYGTLRVADHRDELQSLLSQTVDRYESGAPAAWSMESADADYIDRLSDAIVGFRIRIDRLEACWKLSQHHSAARREGAIRGLRERNQLGDREIAELMQSPPNAARTS